MILADLASRAQTASRSSGTATRPIFASRVENGYFAASAAWVAVNALNKADLPTFGRPTMPQLKPIVYGGGAVAAVASGGAKRRATSLIKASGAPDSSNGMVSATASISGSTQSVTSSVKKFCNT